MSPGDIWGGNKNPPRGGFLGGYNVDVSRRHVRLLAELGLDLRGKKRDDLLDESHELRLNARN